jgi:hypothetical protein
MTALRATAPSGSEPDSPAWVIHVAPEDGAMFVLRDTPILLRLSHPADSASFARGVRVLDAAGEVPTEIRGLSQGLIVLIKPLRLLVPGVEHVLIVRGLLDRRGREMAEHWSRFVPCGLAREDFAS